MEVDKSKSSDEHRASCLLSLAHSSPADIYHWVAPVHKSEWKIFPRFFANLTTKVEEFGCRTWPNISEKVCLLHIFLQDNQLTTAYKLTSFSCLNIFIIFASARKASGDMVPGLRVLIATSVVPFHKPEHHILS